MKNLLFIGLGRIGLPQALVFSQKEFTVFGYDIDEKVVAELKQEKTSFYEPKMQEYLVNSLRHKNLQLLTLDDEFKQALPKIEAIFFTLCTSIPDSQTCLTEEEFDLSNIYTLLDKIFALKKQLRPELALIFRATLPLGTTDQIKHYIESRYFLIEGKDFHLAFVPERLMEGKAIAEEETLPKIIGCYNDIAYEKISAMFAQLGSPIFRVGNTKTAEFCKLTDNSFRNTQFAFSNEIAMHAEENHVDIMEVIGAVNSGYQRNNVPFPGFVSGYCLGKDPYVFEYNFLKTKQNRQFQSLWYYGRKTNDYLVEYVAQKVKHHITQPHMCIAILGLSFKEDIDDFRMSHVFGLLDKLMLEDEITFKFYDPSINKNKYTCIPKKYSDYCVREATVLDPSFFENVDAIIVCHRHSHLVACGKNNLKEILSLREKSVYLYDAWNIWRQAENLPGVIYESLGYKKSNQQQMMENHVG